MNRFLTYFVLVHFLFLLGCASPKPFSVQITRSDTPLSENDAIGMVHITDSTLIPEEYYIGKIKVPQRSGFNNTDITNLLNTYQDIARKNGANIIQITHIYYAKRRNENDLIAATLYRVPDIRDYEKKIYWSNNRKLKWEDFKGAIPDSLADISEYSSYANVSIQHRANATFLVGTNRFFVVSSFDCTKSWYRPYAYYKNNYLEFQQGLFDLTELFARKIKEQLNSKKSKGKSKIDILRQTDTNIGDEYKATENQYVRDTKGGQDLAAIKQWHEKIWKELDQY